MYGVVVEGGVKENEVPGRYREVSHSQSVKKSGKWGEVFFKSVFFSGLLKRKKKRGE